MKRKNFVYLAAELLILNTVIRFILDFLAIIRIMCLEHLVSL